MHILEAALAFAITMLVLSLTCSSFVEILHRIFWMREAGLQYMLGQMFDQVLAKYVEPAAVAQLHGIEAGDKTAAANVIRAARQDFVKRMSANRAPMGVIPSATPLELSGPLDVTAPSRFRLWSGRELSSMTPAEFMERLGSINIGATVKAANDTANSAANTAAGAADAVLKDIAQKFEAFGNEAGTYFQGRARLLSVGVAIVFAFAIRVDAIELFNTYLRDPNARNTVIEQSQAVTAQYKAAKEAAEAIKSLPAANPSTSDEVKKQVEDLQKDLQSTLGTTRNTVTQYADLGLPIGWTKQNATLYAGAKTCVKNSVVRVVADEEKCNAGELESKVGWFAVFRLIGSLFLGGLLIGLGGPFWYDAVTGLTNIRSIAKDVSGGDQKAAPPHPAAPQPAPGQPTVVSGTPDRPQPATAVGAFNVSRAAMAALPVAPAGQQRSGGQ